MSLYNPIGFFFVLTMCALIAEQLAILFKGNNSLVILVFAGELYAFFYLYQHFRRRTAQGNVWFATIFGAFVFLSLTSLLLIGMVSPVGGITALINLLMT